MKKRIIFASQESARVAKLNSTKKVQIYSFFPFDRFDCECSTVINNWKRRLGESSEVERMQLKRDQSFIVCPRDKTNMKRYEISCSNCGETQGYCYATDPTLSDWCDFHYTQWTRGDYWRGCFTPHISPITQQLCFECCCGNDTRDFRANMTLPVAEAEELERKNVRGRNFGNKNSKFIAKEFDNVTVVG